MSVYCRSETNQSFVACQHHSNCTRSLSSQRTRRMSAARQPLPGGRTLSNAHAPNLWHRPTGHYCNCQTFLCRCPHRRSHYALLFSARLSIMPRSLRRAINNLGAYMASAKRKSINGGLDGAPNRVQVQSVSSSRSHLKHREAFDFCPWTSNKLTKFTALSVLYKPFCFQKWLHGGKLVGIAVYRI